MILRDRIVCGINDDATQGRLLAEPDLNYAKAVEIARSMEAASLSMKELKSGPPSVGGYASGSNSATLLPTVHRTSAATGSPESGPVSRRKPICYRCGVKGHRSPNVSSTRTWCAISVARKATCGGRARAGRGEAVAGARHVLCAV